MARVSPHGPPLGDSGSSARSLFAKIIPSRGAASIAWGKAIGQTTAVAGSTNASAIGSIDSMELRVIAVRLTTLQRALDKSRREAPSKDELFGELQSNFAFRNEDKHPAVAPLSRSHRALTRVCDAAKLLDAQIDEFVSRPHAVHRCPMRPRTKEHIANVYTHATSCAPSHALPCIVCVRFR